MFRPLRLIFYIDSIHCGGAQRQLCLLASGLKRIGHDVVVAVYYPNYDFFKPYLRENGVPVVELQKRRPWGMIADLSATVRAHSADWVVPFLEGPSFYALLTKIFHGRFQVCVAERSSNVDGTMKPKQKLIRNLYRVATLVTTNSEYQAKFLARCFPMIANKLATIRNCVGREFFDAYQPDRSRSATWDSERDWLAVVGQIAPWKNLHGLIDALECYHSIHGQPPRIRGAGRPAEDFSEYVQVQTERLLGQPWRDRLEFVGNIVDVPDFLNQSSGLLHPSILEGMPNAVCEAFATGLPAIIGDIADAKQLTGDDRGILFDPKSARSMADAIHQFVRTPGSERDAMGQRARQFARREMEEEAMAIAYSELLIGHTK